MPKKTEEKWPTESAEEIDWERFLPIPDFSAWTETEVKESNKSTDWQSLQLPLSASWDEDAEVDAVEEIVWQRFRQSEIPQTSGEEK